MTEAVARINCVRVRAVRDEILSALAQKGFDFPPFNLDERPNDASAHRRNARETFRTCAAHQMEQHSLQIVVRIVRHRDFGSVRGMLQPCIANTPRGLLHGGIARRRSYVHPLDRQRYAEFAA